MTSKHRKEFETKLLKHMPHANLDFDGEGYTSAWVQAAWTGWNFSVQSLREQSQIQEASLREDAVCDLYYTYGLRDGWNHCINGTGDLMREHSERMRSEARTALNGTERHCVYENVIH